MCNKHEQNVGKIFFHISGYKFCEWYIEWMNDKFVEAMVISISQNPFLRRVHKSHVNEAQY